MVYVVMQVLASSLLSRHPENLFPVFQSHAVLYCSPQTIISSIFAYARCTRSSVTRGKMFPA